MNVPVEIICVFLGSTLALVGAVFGMVLKIDRRLTRIETALKIKGVMTPEDTEETDE